MHPSAWKWAGAATSFTLLAIGCFATGCSGSGGGGSTSAAGASSGSAAGATTQSVGLTTGAGSGSSVGSTSGGATTGGTTGTSGNATASGTTGSPFVDGGYVSCSLSVASDAGPEELAWLCQPGTYLCDLDGGAPGNCFQCLSDSDCANQNLPTYDPRRPHCDLSSGVPRYQNFCQECTTNADCTGNPAGDLCNLNPAVPPGASSNPLVALGFESCSRLLTDCRLDGGPVCNHPNAFCDSANGQCELRSQSCATDLDCAGLLGISVYPLMPEPYCVAGSCSSFPADSSCQLSFLPCQCSGDGDCGGLFPVCLDAGTVQGEPFGLVCGCSSDDQCGDAGLRCLPPEPVGAPSISYCGLPCTSPEYPSCASLGLSEPICDPQTSRCGPCSSDTQCAGAPGGPACDVIAGGLGDCGCIADYQCPAGQTCGSGTFIGACAVAAADCDPGSCRGFFCNWDSGQCVTNVTLETEPSCLTDYDCAGTGSTPFCQAGAGQCVQCRDNQDCLEVGAAGKGQAYCCPPHDANCTPNTCVNYCQTSQDCAHSSAGATCLFPDAGPAVCGCSSDPDCAGNSGGAHCDIDPTDFRYGLCICLNSADCPAATTCVGGACQPPPFCQQDADCPTDFFCTQNESCRPRCDPGHSCAAPDSICDTANLVGQNGSSISGPDSGATWCYQCLKASDCDGGAACASYSYVCGFCVADRDCPAGDVCLNNNSCRPSCDAGPCPAGQICDSADLAGYGPNICFDCLGPVDCPNGEGCDGYAHTCGTCRGPNADTGTSDCPPGDICSSYWSPSVVGVCLADCDQSSCPADQPICALFAPLSQEHEFCFGCLQDSDCADAGAGAWCDNSVGLTFRCQVPPAP